MLDSGGPVAGRLSRRPILEWIEASGLRQNPRLPATFVATVSRFSFDTIKGDKNYDEKTSSFGGCNCGL
jgi:hypothetical protein